MLFRYKVKPNTSLGIGNPISYNHYVKIQMYNENAHVFRWRTVKDTTLCHMAFMMYDFPDMDYSCELSATQLHSILNQYDNMGDFVKKYIIDILYSQWREHDETHEYEDQIFKFAVTDGWNAIEIKEDKN